MCDVVFGNDVENDVDIVFICEFVYFFDEIFVLVIDCVIGFKM